MGRRAIVVGVWLSLGCGAGACGCSWQADRVGRESSWLLARATAHAEEYVRSLDGASADQELAAFEAHRALLERTLLWQQLQTVLTLGAGALAFATYALRVAGTIKSMQPLP